MSNTKKQIPHNQDFLNTSFLDGANALYIEKLYAQFLEDPHSVHSEMVEYFEALQESEEDIQKNAHGPSWKNDHWPALAPSEIVKSLEQDTKKVETAINKHVKGDLSSADSRQAVLRSIRAIMLIRAFRVRGHLIADLDPLGLMKKIPHPELDYKTYGFVDGDMDDLIFLDGVLGLKEAKLSEIISILHRTYGKNFAIEFMHISDPDEKSWLQKRIEGRDKEIHFNVDQKQEILDKLIQAEGFEKFLHTKYMGTKRFGLDGAESLIPGLEQMIHSAACLGVEQMVFGMPHRGRLNVLSSILGKSYVALLSEFQGGSANPDDVGGSGDVKYHLGVSQDRNINGRNMHLTLVPNPSHLEAVNPVVVGKVRAKQEKYGTDKREKVVPVLLHGDAAFAGQGVVAECFAISGLHGYGVGGTIHCIVNNQIGFTTTPDFGRSTPYPSDVAKGAQAPIFHVNGDDPEAVCFAFKVATEFRQKFKKDVVVDLICYRRYGHNEGDEPSFTQPLMYKKIRTQQTVLSQYTKKLDHEKVISLAASEEKINDFHQMLQQNFDDAKSYKPNRADWLDGNWQGMGERSSLPSGPQKRTTDTNITTDILQEIGKKLVDIPKDFVLHRTLKRGMDAKEKMFETAQGFDWATAEALAFGSLVLEGYPVRLSGQDCCRGTFSHRHARLTDQSNEDKHFPLKHISKDQATFDVLDSALSEYAVLGFEYGYSWEDPNGLTLWEGQFGDFFNGAQIIIDQFITSAETKWLRMSGLVMLLPHGYEGQGPEHSSARLERFLQQCAEDNIQVVNCTTPANYFHVLRRQIHRDFRKPLIVMSPKSLLRHRLAVSNLTEMSGDSYFNPTLLDDLEDKNTDLSLVEDQKIKRVVVCTGKIYYDLFEQRQARNISDIYLLRLEQLYPFPQKEVLNILGRFENADIIWCQEEPRNMGAWTFIDPLLEEALSKTSNKISKRARFVGRDAAASTATGLASKHKAQQEKILHDALTI